MTWSPICRNVLVVLFVSLLTGKIALAQPAYSQLNALAFPSANNSFLGKGSSATNVGVDFYTGMAQVSVPICNLQSKELSIPVSLDYVDGRGIRVQEYASQVGLGWHLNAGGSVSRVVRGFPDEQPNGYLGTGGWGSILNTAIANNTAISTPNYTKLSGCTPDNNNFLVCSALPIADGEPDIFFVKTPFFSFQFVFDQTGQPIFSNYNGYQVIPNIFPGGNPAKSAFEVIDDKGNQFYFGSTSQAAEYSTDSLYNVPYNFPTSWYLDKIVTFNGKDVITLTYQAATGNDINYSYSWSEIQNSLLATKTTLSTGQNTITNPKYVSTIVSQLGELDFTYSFDRQDDAAAARLSGIVLKALNPQTGSNSNTLSSYAFNYSYFNPSGSANLKRLCLNNVQVTPTGAPAFSLASFGYNTSVNLPDRTQPIFDYWGYCTTAQSTPANIYSVSRSPDAVMTQADILNSITTPGGGTWNLFYELNTYGPGITNVGGLRVNKVSRTLPTGESLFKTYSYLNTDGSGYSSGQIFSNLYSQLSFFFDAGNGQSATLYMSGSPYLINDLNGNFVGYSTVKETNQDNSSTVYNFTNFNDAGCNDVLTTVGSSAQVSFPLVLSTTSVSYKRGLLKSMTTYDAANNSISNDIFSYTSLIAPATQHAYGYRPFNISAVLNNIGGSISGFYSLYSTPVENYRLTQTTHTDFSQPPLSANVQRTTSYGYDANHWLVSNLTTTDSKGLSYSKAFYHPGDASIPMEIGSEAAALGIMSSPAVNCRNVLIHETDTRNGVVRHAHNSYSAFQVGSANNIFLTTSSIYSGNTLEHQQFFNYDALTAQLVSSYATGDKSISVAYGYNTSYPLAKVSNAASTASHGNVPASVQGTLQVPGSQFPSLNVSFTTVSAGTITIAMPPGSYLGGPNIYAFFSFSLSGPSTGSGTLCNSSTPNYTCTGTNSVSLPNMAAGNYTLFVSVLENTVASVNSIPVTYTYSGQQVGATGSSEFFFEGFEQNFIGTVGASHTGNAYYASNYTVPFTMPSPRSYLIQWWNLSAGKWVFNQQSYTNGMTLTGPVDDVRVFPADALMTSYTYNPLQGKTSETDPSGKSQTYEYDGLGRLVRVRDQDNNILKQFDYEYQQPTPNPQYTVTLANQSQYPASIVSVTIDGTAYPIPASGATNTLAITLTAGAHTITLANGPSSCYTINGTSYTAAQTPVSYTVNSNLTIAYVNSCPPVINSVACNLTSDATDVNACSCHGCQYTATVYYTGSIGPGTQLYTDNGLTTKVTGKTWFFPYTGTNVWPLNSLGAITGTPLTCQ
jgi:YD repeat-containing protein